MTQSTRRNSALALVLLCAAGAAFAYSHTRTADNTDMTCTYQDTSRAVTILSEVMGIRALENADFSCMAGPPGTDTLVGVKIANIDPAQTDPLIFTDAAEPQEAPLGLLATLFPDPFEGRGLDGYVVASGFSRPWNASVHLVRPASEDGPFHVLIAELL